MKALMKFKFKRFFSLSSVEKRLFVEAFVTLGMMRAALVFVSFKRLTKNLKKLENEPAHSELSGEQEKLAKTTGRLIVKAAHNTPWESACLVQSLTAQRMLKRRGIPGVFYLGVMKGDSVREELKAHAWTRCGGETITGEEGHEKFKVMTVFQW